MRTKFTTLALLLLSSPASAGWDGVWIAAGGGISRSSVAASASSTTVAAGRVVATGTEYEKASGSAPVAEAAVLWQSHWGPALTGLEVMYQRRDLDLGAPATIYAPGMRAVDHLGDKLYATTRLGLELTPGLFGYVATGVSYAPWNGDQLIAANGATVSEHGRRDLALVIGGGLQYHLTDRLMLDGRFTATPGDTAHSGTTLRLGQAAQTIVTDAAGDWTYSGSLRLAYRLQ